jgi:hypothetical protein
LKNLKTLYEEDKSPEILTEMVELQIKKIHPLVETIRLLKYSYNTVEYNENDETYHLVQEVATPRELELNFDGEKEVIVKSFDQEAPQKPIAEAEKKVEIMKEQIPRAPIPPFDEAKLAIMEKRVSMLEKEYEKDIRAYGEYIDGIRLLKVIREKIAEDQARKRLEQEAPAQ